MNGFMGKIKIMSLNNVCNATKCQHNYVSFPFCPLSNQFITDELL